jgi:hypothetical protein
VVHDGGDGLASVVVMVVVIGGDEMPGDGGDRDAM